MLTMKDIIREGHKTLETVAKDVALPLSDADKQTLKLMREFLINSQDEEIAEKYALRAGVGLAAPQINLSKRMLAIYTLDENFEVLHDYLMVNPKIISHTEMLTFMPGGEGCLSIDRAVEGLVPRYKRVTVKTHLYDTKTDTLKEETLRLKGFVSIVFQHELDHLNGILFPSKVTPTLEGVEPVHFKTIEKEEANNETVY
ncbi:MAG: peptide deformylase [Candidatus Izemoplasmataceae bacterium]